MAEDISPVERKEISAKEPSAPAAKAEAGFLSNWFLQYYRFATMGACLIFLALGYFLLLGPKIARARNIRNVTLAQEKQRQAELTAKLSYLIRLARKKEEMGSEQIERINNMLPSDPNLAALFTTLEGLARDSGAIVESISINVPQPAKPGRGQTAATAAAKGLPEGVKSVDLTVKVTAEDYRQLKVFLANAERASRLLDAVALNYSPAGSTYTLTLRTYFQPERASDAPAPAPAPSE